MRVCVRVGVGCVGLCGCVCVCMCLSVCVCVCPGRQFGVVSGCGILLEEQLTMCVSVGVCGCILCVCVCVCPGKCPGQYQMRESDGFCLLCFETWWSARQMILRISEKLPILLEHLRTDLTQLMGGQRYFLEIRRNESGKLLETIRTVT